MDIVIVSQYLRNIEDFEGNNSRFVYLAKMLEKQHEVEIITSDFMHAPKVHAKGIGDLGKIKVTAIHEPGYPKNVCLRRFASHGKLAQGIETYLDGRKKPDVCYCAIPSLDVAYTVAKYCEKNSIRFIVDIQDLWPEAFKMVFHIPVVCDLIFAPMQKKADKVYALADEIVAVSKTYSDRGMKVNAKCKSPTVVFLGTELETFDGYVVDAVPNSNKNEKLRDIIKDIQRDCSKIIRIAYCGTLGHSYDITCVIEAIKSLDSNIRNKIEFVVLGDGPRKSEFMQASEGLPIVFTGRIPYPEMVWVLSRCDIAVNPITKGAAQSIINKHGDYAASGLPVINTQESFEYKALVEQYEMGFNCENNDPLDVADKIQHLIENEQLRVQMGKNARRCAEENFDRKSSYKLLYKVVTELKNRDSDMR